MRTVKKLPYRKVADITDAFIDGLYLAESLVDYLTLCDTSSISEAGISKLNFYQGDTIPLALVEMMLLTGYSVYCRSIKQKQDGLDLKNNAIALHLMWSWPYFRDFLSGLKNGRHAIVNTGFIAQHASSINLYHFTNPIGIAIGVALAINLMCYRKMNNNRKENIQSNNKLLKKIIDNDLTELDDKIIHNQRLSIKSLCYLSALFDGATDGAYLYGCLFILIGLGVSSLSGGAPLIAAMTVCTLMTVISTICKLEQEYQAQKSLQNSSDACHAALAKNRGEVEAEKSHAKPSIIKQSVLNIGFFAIRNTISGAKNAKAAIDSIKAFFCNLIIKAILSGVAIVTAMMYATYLVIKNSLTPQQKPAFDYR